MKTSKVFVNSFYYGVVPKLSIFANILVLPLITPFLTTYDYGISGVVFSYTDIFVSIAPLGLNLYLTNSFYEMPRNYNLVWGRIYYLYLLSGIVFSIVNTILILFSLHIDSYWSLLLIGILGSAPIISFSSASLAGSLFPYLEKPKPLVITNLLISLCGIGVLFVSVYCFRLGFWGLIAQKVFLSYSSLLVFAVILRKYNIKPIIEIKWRRIKEMLAKSLPLVPHTLGFMLLANSARIILNIYNVDYDEIGLYSHGYQMGTYVIIVTSAMATALAPQMQTTFRKGDYSSFRMLYYLSQGVALLASFLICIWMREIYSVLIQNDHLSKSSSIAVLFCFAQVLIPFYHFSSISCFVDRKTQQLLWLVFVPSLGNIILCSVLVPIFGYMSAVYSTIASFWSVILMPFIIPYHKKWTNTWLGSKKKLVLLFVIAVVFLVTGNVISSCGFLIKILISFISICACAYVFFTKLNPLLKKI